MLIGKVIGSVVSTRKDDRLVGHKLLIVRPLVPGGDDVLEVVSGRCLVSVDLVGAGKGETVLMVSGSTARAAASVDSESPPIDACIVGIVDSVEVEGREVHYA